jgi:hypothetical protein
MVVRDFGPTREGRQRSDFRRQAALFGSRYSNQLIAGVLLAITADQQARSFKFRKKEGLILAVLLMEALPN